MPSSLPLHEQPENYANGIDETPLLVVLEALEEKKNNWRRAQRQYHPRNGIFSPRKKSLVASLSILYMLCSSKSSSIMLGVHGLYMQHQPSPPGCSTGPFQSLLPFVRPVASSPPSPLSPARIGTGSVRPKHETEEEHSTFFQEREVPTGETSSSSLFMDDGESMPNALLDYSETVSPSPTGTGTFTATSALDSGAVWVDQLSTDPEDGSNFSLLSWNILAQSLYQKAKKNNNGEHPIPGKDSGKYIFSWDARLEWIVKTLEHADADIVCLQEVESIQVFEEDLLPALQQLGYHGVIQGGDDDVKEIKRRKGKGQRAHSVATFWKTDKLSPAFASSSSSKDDADTEESASSSSSSDKVVSHMARGRTLTSLLRPKASPSKTMAVINCHLEGHPRQYAARMQQLQNAMEDLAKQKHLWSQSSDSASPPSSLLPLHGLILAGDMNCELSSSVCSTYIKRGRVGRQGGLGGVHGTSAMAMPAWLLDSQEAMETLTPVTEWGQLISQDELDQLVAEGSVRPHPFRRNTLVSAYNEDLNENIDGHFTYCATPHRPVAGLDQLWFSSSTLTRRAIRRTIPSQSWLNHSMEQNKCTHRDQLRESILKTGLPTQFFPSDHLPIGSILEWHDNNGGTSPRQLYITEDIPTPPPPPKSPIMAYAEYDLLLATAPYDTDSQRATMDALLDDTTTMSDQLDADRQTALASLGPNARPPKPSKEQLQELAALRARKQVLLDGATDRTRPVLQRIFSLHKKVTAYD